MKTGVLVVYLFMLSTSLTPVWSSGYYFKEPLYPWQHSSFYPTDSSFSLHTDDLLSSDYESFDSAFGDFSSYSFGQPETLDDIHSSTLNFKSGSFFPSSEGQDTFSIPKSYSPGISLADFNPPSLSLDYTGASGIADSLDSDINSSYQKFQAAAADLNKIAENIKELDTFVTDQAQYSSAGEHTSYSHDITSLGQFPELNDQEHDSYDADLAIVDTHNTDYESGLSSLSANLPALDKFKDDHDLELTGLDEALTSSVQTDNERSTFGQNLEPLAINQPTGSQKKISLEQNLATQPINNDQDQNQAYIAQLQAGYDKKITRDFENFTPLTQFQANNKQQQTTYVQNPATLAQFQNINGKEHILETLTDVQTSNGHEEASYGQNVGALAQLQAVNSQELLHGSQNLAHLSQLQAENGQEQISFDQNRASLSHLQLEDDQEEDSIADDLPSVEPDQTGGGVASFENTQVEYNPGVETYAQKPITSAQTQTEYVQSQLQSQNTEYDFIQSQTNIESNKYDSSIIPPSRIQFNNQENLDKVTSHEYSATNIVPTDIESPNNQQFSFAPKPVEQIPVSLPNIAYSQSVLNTDEISSSTQNEYKPFPKSAQKGEVYFTGIGNNANLQQLSRATSVPLAKGKAEEIFQLGYENSNSAPVQQIENDLSIQPPPAPQEDTPIIVPIEGKNTIDLDQTGYSRNEPNTFQQKAIKPISQQSLIYVSK
ncbi:uncharacterized protein LOC143254390 [Tachypleus tridentatus]|uniref:uncharacterized protein LOC143254390 n=1 Tax=Tachypleus tridentatus TaxID=6853 RepID=UPI003FD19238